MSFAGKDDKDRKNKILLFNFLWNCGFITRLEIPVYQYLKGEKFGKELTDLDILGWKYMPFIGIIKITASAKGEAKNVSHTSEIFKLKGVNNLFKPLQSFYIHDSSPTDELYWFSKELGIEILSKSSLVSINNRKEFFFNLTEKGANRISESLLILKDISKYYFITSEFWLSQKPEKFYRLEGLLKESIIKFSNIEEDKNFLLILYLISLYIISIIEILEVVQNTSQADFNFKMKLAMYGGKDIYKNTTDLIDVMNAFLKTQDHAKQNIFKYDAFIPNFEAHSELIRRAFLNIESTFITLRCFDFLILNFAENGKILDINSVIDDFTKSPTKKIKSLELLRHIFIYLSQNISSNFRSVAKKLNILR